MWWNCRLWWITCFTCRGKWTSNEKKVVSRIIVSVVGGTVVPVYQMRLFNMPWWDTTAQVTVSEQQKRPNKCLSLRCAAIALSMKPTTTTTIAPQAKQETSRVKVTHLTHFLFTFSRLASQALSYGEGAGPLRCTALYYCHQWFVLLYHFNSI